MIQVLLGHAKLDTTALYTQVATKTIRDVTSPLDRIAIDQDGRAARLTRGADGRVQLWRSRTSSATTDRRGVEPMPAM